MSVQKVLALAVMTTVAAFAAPAYCAGYTLANDGLQFSVNLDLAPYWDGVLAIKQIGIDPRGTATINNLSIKDRLGRPWLEVESAKVEFAKAANSKVKLASVRIDNPHVTLWLDANGLSMPKGTEYYSTDELPEFFDLQEVGINNAMLTIADTNVRHTWKNINFAALRKSDARAFEVRLAVVNDTNIIYLSGTVDVGNRKVDLKCRGTYLADANETAAVARLLEIPFFHHASGKIETGLKIKGWPGEVGFWPNGWVKLGNVSLFTEYGLFANGLESEIIFSDRQARFDIIQGQVLAGVLEGSGSISIDPNQAIRIAGELKLDSAELTQLSTALGKPNLFKKGKGSAVYSFRFESGRLESLKAHGLLFLDDADLWNVPVVSHLFKYLRFSSKNPLTLSDVAVHYTMNGPVVTIDRAELTSPLVAVEFEKGSTLNLETHIANGYANVVFIQKIGNLIAKIPFIQPFINLKNKLTRVEIRGDWKQPSGLVIRKNVVGDIKAGALGFFMDAAKAGGQLDKSATDSFTTLYKNAEKKL